MQTCHKKTVAQPHLQLASARRDSRVCDGCERRLASARRRSTSKGRRQRTDAGSRFTCSSEIKSSFRSQYSVNQTHRVPLRIFHFPEFVSRKRFKRSATPAFTNRQRNPRTLAIKSAGGAYIPHLVTGAAKQSAPQRSTEIRQTRLANMRLVDGSRLCHESLIASIETAGRVLEMHYSLTVTRTTVPTRKSNLATSNWVSTEDNSVHEP